MERLCKNCNSDISHKPSQNKFCSQSCSATFNNKLRAKKPYYCQKCESLMGHGFKFSRRKYCDKCNVNIIDWSTVTYGELKEKRKYQENSRIRTLARNSAEKLGKLKECSNCGYNIHVETCHVKAIINFSDDTKISEINSPDNIVGLCRNCHWEFDNGLLEFNPEWL